MLTKVL
jgi:hypothetical protein